MKAEKENLAIRDVVYYPSENDFMQIQNEDQLKIVKEFWEIDFTGLELSESVLNNFWSEFLPSNHSAYIKKFNFLDWYNDDKILFSFYGVYSRKDLPPILKINIPGGGEGFVQYFEDTEIFKHCFCYKKGKKVFFKYVHQLQSILDSREIRRPLYGRINFPLSRCRGAEL